MLTKPTPRSTCVHLLIFIVVLFVYLWIRCELSVPGCTDAASLARRMPAKDFPDTTFKSLRAPPVNNLAEPRSCPPQIILAAVNPLARARRLHLKPPISFFPAQSKGISPFAGRLNLVSRHLKLPEEAGYFAACFPNPLPGGKIFCAGRFENSVEFDSASFTGENCAAWTIILPTHDCNYLSAFTSHQ